MLSLSLFLSSCSLNVRFCWRLRINMNRVSAYTDSESSRWACSCNCTPTRPTTVGYRLDLDNDSPSGHRALTVSPSPRIFFPLPLHICSYARSNDTLLSIFTLCTIHIYVFLYTQEFQVIDMALIYNDLYTHRHNVHAHFNLIGSKEKIKNKNVTLID